MHKIPFYAHTGIVSEVMIPLLYLQLKPRVVIAPGEKLTVRHIADAINTENAEVMELPVECPDTAGVWRLPAMAVIKAVIGRNPDVSILGPAECYVHIVPESKRNRTHLVRAIFAFLLLLIGSALAITWFHADVNMLDAQQGLFRLITGKEADNIWLITIPYALGVFFGVALFYALLGKKRTTSPLEIKLEEYRKSAEEATGKMP